MDLEIRLLDAPAVVVSGDVRPVTRRREQAVLARLALAAPGVVPVEVLVEDVWGAAPPPTAVEALRVNVSNLRKLLADGARPAGEVLSTVPGGYRLDVRPEAVDVTRLESAGELGDADALAALLGAWPEDDLARFDTGSGFFAAAARRADDARVAAVETTAALALQQGRPAPAVALLEGAVLRAPHRERLWALLVQALAAQDRSADALRAYQRAREALAELGLTPGAALAAAEAAVLVRPDDREVVAHYVDVDGSRVAYATVGSGPVDLLFLHGGFIPFDTMRDTPRLARFLDALAERFRVLLVDRRGIGMSDGPADGAPVHLDHWVADCRAVLDAVGSRQVVVLGHEHGGPVAIRLAAQRPDLVAGLVLHSTAARPLRGPDHPYGPSEEQFDRLDRMIDRLPGSEDVLRLVAASAGEDPQLRAWLDRAGRLGASPSGAKQLHRAYLGSDVRGDLLHVRAPAVVLHPARMIRTDPGQARYIAERLGDADLQLLDSADHLFWLADADTVLAAIDRLRARLAGREHPAAPATLRALVAVAPPELGDVLAGHRPEAQVRSGHASVAVFTSMADAQVAAAAVREAEPGAAVAVEAADTTARAGDPAVERLAAAVAPPQASRRSITESSPP